MPAEAEATEENRPQSFSTAASGTGPAISPSATATPSAEAPRE